MNPANTLELTADANTEPDVKNRRSSTGQDPLIFTDIYEDDVNIVTWQRQLAAPLQKAVRQFLSAHPGFQTAITTSPEEALANLSDELGSEQYRPLAEDMAELINIFCCLFEIKRAGVRLAALDKAMCPKFHVDRVPCRLITTYQGIATEWLPHDVVDRSKLGAGSRGLPDHESGLYPDANAIQHLQCGDVALLKGENWYDNENAGLVHRSPAVAEGERRLVLTLDFAD